MSALPPNRRPEAVDSRRRFARFALAALRLGLLVGCCIPAGCAVLDVKASGPIVGRTGWVLLPVQNQGETTMAGERVEELLLTLMRTQKDIELAPYQLGREAKEGDLELTLDDRQRYERTLAWAREKKYSYGIGGSVQELRYRAGSEGEPAVGLTVRVVDLSSGRIVFAASGSSATLGQGSLSGTTQKLLRSMLGKLAVE